MRYRDYRKCKVCQKDIVNRGFNAVYCQDCSDWRRKYHYLIWGNKKEED